MKIKFHLLLFSAVILVISCKRSSDKPLWDVDLLTPIVQSSLTISNLIKDTTNIHLNSDKSITIVSRQSLSDVTLDSLVTLNTDPFSETQTLSSLVLPTRHDTTYITVASIGDKLIATGDPDNILYGTYLKYQAANNGVVDLSGIPDLFFNNIDLDISSFFEYANIATGTLTIEIINTLPADVTSLNFAFKNKVNGDPITSHTFSNIPMLGGSSSYTEDLSGKMVEGVLTGDIAPLHITGPTNAVVSSNQAIIVVMTISGVTVTSAKAVFPDQDILSKQEETSLTTLGDVLLKKATIDEGAMKLHVVSTLQQEVDFTYTIPGAMKDGLPFVQTASVAAATVVSGSVVPATGDATFDLKGYGMDFTGIAQDTFNTFYYTLTARIKSNGVPVDLALSDYITVTVSGQGLKPSYVEGYLGQNTIIIGPDDLDLTIFKGVESGTLAFENINMNLVVDNGFGIPAQVTVSNMTSSNSHTGQFYSLTGLPPLTINRAPSLGTSAVSTIPFGPNAKNLINILPDKVAYAVQVQTNPAGDNLLYQDFASKDGLMKAYLDIEMPLSIQASKLVLMDTSAFDMSVIKKKNVKSGTFKVFVENGFPLSASLRMYFKNAYGDSTTSLLSLPDVIQAAPVDASYRVIEKRASQMAFEVDEQTMELLYNSSFVIFKLEFSTVPAGNNMKIYSDYSIDFKMVGDMDYAVHKK